jgi:tetratricopeptide (TPR) repeat protein
MKRLRLGLVAAVLLGLPLAAQGPSDTERLKNAKALFFDGKYSEAREAWQAIRAAGGPEADTAVYWSARSSEGLGELERALQEYGAYLDLRPRNRALADEARTGRVGLAAKLYKSGRTQHLGVLTAALKDENRTVRYFTALQLGGLGAPVGAPAVPVLCQIVSAEHDPDLVDRARLVLLRVDSKALSGSGCGASQNAPPERVTTPHGRAVSWIRVRIYDHGQSQPALSMNLPLALGDLIFKSLPEEARQDLRKKGYDADNFWARLKQLGPTEIIAIEGGDGGRVQIWTE